MQRKHDIAEVFAAMVAAFIVVMFFDAHGLYQWSRGLPQYGAYSQLSKRLESHWGNMEKVYLAAPKHHLKTVWMDFQEGHKLLYPKTYADHKALQKKRAMRRLAKSKPKLQKSPKAPKIVKSKRKKPQGRLKMALASKLKRGPLQADLSIKESKPRKISGIEKKGSVGGPRVFLLGDSMMVSLAPMLKKALAKVGGTATVDARVSTGLARPDVYDWPQAVQQKRGPFDYLVVVLGTNDGQHFYRRGKVIPYGSQQWVKEYRRRLRSMMAESCAVAAKEVLWLGLPPMRKSSFNRKIHRLNTWIKRQARNYPCVRYINLTPLYGDNQGRYTAYKNLGQRPVKIRTSDGIHITRKGGEILSRAIVPLMKEESKPAH